MSFPVTHTGPLTPAEAEAVVQSNADAIRRSIDLHRRRAVKVQQRAVHNLKFTRGQGEAFENELFRSAQLNRRALELENVLRRHGLKP